MIMYFTKKISINSNLLIVLFVFVAYALLGFIDDFMKIRKKQNEGLTDVQKLLGQVIIAVVFFFIYMKSGSEPLLWFHAFNLKVNVGWLYGFFILFMLVASSNAVNITDGLDGIAGGLSFNLSSFNINSFIGTPPIFSILILTNKQNNIKQF